VSRDEQTLHRLEEAAQRLAQVIAPAFDAAGACFAVLGFTIGEGGWATWVSNAERGDVITALREMADNLERKLDTPPGSRIQ